MHQDQRGMIESRKQAPPSEGGVAADSKEFARIDGADGYRMAVFADRVEYHSGDGTRGIWGSIPLAAITGVGVEVRPKDRGLLVWGILGLIAAFGIYQVATNANVANFGSFAVAAISGVLLIQYYFRPPGLQLVVYTGGSSKAIPLRGDSLRSARAFATEVIDARDRSAPQTSQEPAWTQPRYPMA